MNESIDVGQELIELRQTLKDITNAFALQKKIADLKTQNTILQLLLLAYLVVRAVEVLI